MRKYLDRKALIAAMENVSFKTSHGLTKEQCDGANFARLTLATIIKALPAADVIDVVRCRDCKHYNTFGCAKGFGWCHLHGIGHASMDYWFCAGGKRDGGENQ